MERISRIYRTRRSQRGSVIVLVAVLLVVMILFVGLVIDVGFAYVTKASLSKAVDAACLTGVRNLSQGESQVEALARNAFNLNYGVSGRDSNPPTVDIVFSTDASNNKVLTVNATAKINTFFIRILPEWTTMDVGASAQATRSKLVMSLVLDRSNSMNNNRGAAALPDAVETFVDFFDDNLDQVAMTSFASDARVDVQMGPDFKNPVRNAVHAMRFTGATFAHGGMLKAQSENNQVGVAPGENVTRIVVFFTDGIANTVQSTFDCPPPMTILNFSGNAPSEGNAVFFMDPITGNEKNGSCHITSGGSRPGCCGGAVDFVSSLDKRHKTFTTGNLKSEAEGRTLQLADQLRSQGTIVYAIGLGNNINRDFLLELANDPSSPGFNSGQPAGEAAFAPDASDLAEVFQKIASKILLRLTQ